MPLLVAGIALVSLNLRPAIAAVGPIAGDIRMGADLSSAAVGLLTTLPLLAFGLVSVMTPLLTRRLGIGRTLLGALIVLALATATRAIPGHAFLFGGTIILGVAIALANVLLPALVKRDFAPERAGPMTSLYSSGIGLGAALGAGASAPVALWLGWRGALAVWGVFALVALVVWLPQIRGPIRKTEGRDVRAALSSLGRSPLAWQVALYLGLQSLTFYVVLAWLPDILQSRGLTAAESGGLLALSQIIGISGSVVAPIWAGRVRDQRAIVWTLGVGEAIALTGLLTGWGPLTLWVVLLGIVLGGTFGLGLLFLVLRASDAATAGDLSGVAQSAGYLIAAIGPFAIGALFDWTGSWTPPLLALAVVLLVKTVIGLGAGRDRVVASA